MQMGVFSSCWSQSNRLPHKEQNIVTAPHHHLQWLVNDSCSANVHRTYSLWSDRLPNWKAKKFLMIAYFSMQYIIAGNEKGDLNKSALLIPFFFHWPYDGTTESQPWRTDADVEVIHLELLTPMHLKTQHVACHLYVRHRGVTHSHLYLGEKLQSG